MSAWKPKWAEWQPYSLLGPSRGAIGLNGQAKQPGPLYITHSCRDIYIYVCLFFIYECKRVYMCAWVCICLCIYIMAHHFGLLVLLRLHRGAALTQDLALSAHVPGIRDSTCKARSVAEMASLGGLSHLRASNKRMLHYLILHMHAQCPLIQIHHVYIYILTLPKGNRQQPRLRGAPFP